ncbi:MAG: hypothetical protein HY820_29340 [Acidobacteria bacterium]|nr:hypothetical protein [Acidobacteriota bacterium]
MLLRRGAYIHSIVMNQRSKLLRLTCLFVLDAMMLSAHPMGNFSISHYTRLQPGPERLEMVYALDFAQIPASELLRDWKLARTSPRADLDARALEQARVWLAAVSLKAGGAEVKPVVQSAELVIADGPVLRITVKAVAAVKPGRLTYEDRNYPDRAGWKEIVVAVAPGAALTMASHSDKDVSKALSQYPEDPAVAPPQDLRAQLEWTAPGTVEKGDVLSQLLSRQSLGLSAMLVAIAAAFGFGAMHALSPGHGKTIVAAYLVGSRGTFRHALFLGGMVTATHTVSVFLLGLGTLFLSQYIVADKIYPILGVISGLTIVVIGATLFYKRLGKLARHSHHHHHHHDHHHHDHGHSHDHHHGVGGHSHVVEGDVTFASLTGLAVSGGLVPCPSALVLLLSSIALGRVGFGLVLLTSFSLGLALVLIAIGGLVLYAKHLLPDTPRVQRSPFFVMVPVISAAVITCVGIFMTLVAMGVVKSSIPV